MMYIAIQSSLFIYLIWHSKCNSHSLNDCHLFIACLAFSDFISGLGGIIGTYREDLGRVDYYWPIVT